MNRVYRLVFNRTLGVMQVASELAKGARGGADTGGGAAMATLQPISFALWVALGWVGMVQPLSAQQAGQIIADPGAPAHQRPTVLTTANGTPQVNITTPSAAGVSRNSYRQFDVGSQGAVLNNARGNVQTEIGGWVQANPWLATGTARVILNEVNSSAPSQLRGYVEVAGDRAQVVIANPAGIQIDGAGFLNASRVTLTTGTPVISGGSLDGYRVQGGRISVSGAGLDTSRADYTDIITRSLDVNAGIWANRLQASLGAAVVSADPSSVVAQPADSAAPAYALDVGALGGMYANRIWLVGNEHGVGVRNAGQIGAQAGELVVTVDGRLENSGALQSQQDTVLTATAGIANQGTISAAREARISTAGEVDNSSGTLNARRIQVSADTLRNAGGAIEQAGTQALHVRADILDNRAGGVIGTVATTPAGGSNGAPGSIDPGTGISPGSGTTPPGTGTPPGAIMPPTQGLATGMLDIANRLDNDGGRIDAVGTLDLQVRSGLDNSGGSFGVDALHLQGGALRNVGGTLNVQGDATVQASEVDNSGGRLSVSRGFALGAQTLRNQGGMIAHGDTRATAWSITGHLDNRDGSIASNATAFGLAAGSLVNAGGAITHAGAQGLTLRAETIDGSEGAISTAGALSLHAGTVDHRGAALTATQISVQADAFDNRGGTVASTGERGATLSVRDTLDNGNGGTLASNGDLSIAAATFGNAGGTVQQAGSGQLLINTGTLDGAKGTLLSNGALAVRGDSIDLRDGVTSAQRINIIGRDLTTAGGKLTATGTDALTLMASRRLDNSGGTIGSNGALEVRAGSLLNNQGTLIAAGTAPSLLRVDGTFENRGGTLSVNGDTQVQAVSMDNAGGRVATAADARLQLHVEGLLDNHNSGRIASGGDLQLSAAQLDNRDGAIEQAGDGALAIIVGDLQGAGGTIASNGGLDLQGGTLDLRKGDTRARRIHVAADSLTTAEGSLSSSGDDALQLDIADTLNNDGGTVAANGAQHITAGALSNRGGTLSAAGNADSRVQVSAAFDNNNGTVAANARALQLSAAHLDNTRGKILHAGDQGLHVQVGTLDGQHGSIATAGAVALSAGTVDHRNATISATQITLDAVQFDNRGGSVVATGQQANALQVAGALDNSDGGTLASNGDLSITATTFGNAGGTVQQAGNGTLAITAATLNGEGGTLLSNGALAISGNATDLRGGTTSAQRIQIATGDLTTAGGQLTALGTDVLDLQVRGTLDNRAGSLASNGALSVGATTLLNQRGTLIAAGADASRIAVRQQLDNQNGSITSNGAVHLSAGVLRNVDGTVVAAGEGALRIDTDTLDGAGGTLASNGALDLHADHVDLAKGKTTAKQVTVTANSLVTADGTLVSTGDDAMTLQVRDTLDNDRGSIGANGAQHITAGTLSNRGGTLSSAGSADSQIGVSGTFDNTQGTVASNGAALGLQSGSLINSDGTISHAGSNGLTLSTGVLDGQRGTIATAGALQLTAERIDHRNATLNATQLTLQAADVDNRGGRIVATGQQANTVDVSGLLDNGAGGTLASNGDLSITASTLGNAGGTVQQAGTGLLAITADTLDGQGGTLLSNGTLDLRGDHTDLRNGTTSAQRIRIATGDLTTAGGQLTALGADVLQLQVRGTLDNSGGTLGGNGTLDLRAAHLLNHSGTLQAAGDGSNQLTIGSSLDNRDGRILTTGNATVTAATLDNRGGTVSTAGTSTLTVDVDGALDNSAKGILSSGGDLRVAAATLGNQGGSIEHAGDGTLDIEVTALMGEGGRIVSNGDLQLRGETLDLAEGSTAAKQVSITAGALSTAGGTLSSTGDAAMSLQVREALNNDNGRIAANGAQHIQAGSLSNREGVLSSAGTADTLIAVAGAFDNTAGTLASNADALALSSGSLVNQHGTISHAGRDGLTLTTGALDGQHGQIASAGSITLSAGTVDHRNATLSAAQINLQAAGFDNRAGSVVATGPQASSLTVSGTLDNGAGGTLASNGDLSITASTFGNAGGTVQHAGSGLLAITASHLAGEGGTLLSNGTLEVRGDTTTLRDGTTSARRISISTGDLTTAGGTLSATGTEALSLDVRNRLDNSGGTLGSNGALDIRAAELLNHQGTLQGAGTGGHQIIASNALVNQGGRILTAGDTTVRAGTLDNRSGTLNTGGTASLTVTVDGLIDNTAQGLVASGGDAQITAQSLDNQGGTLAAGQSLALTTQGRVHNDAGLIQASGDLQLASSGLGNAAGKLIGASVAVDTRAAQLDNRGGTIASLAGPLSVRSGALDNTAGLLQSAGALDIDTAGQTLINVDSNGNGIVSSGALVIRSGSLDNRNGAVFAQQGAQINANDIDNRSNGSLVSGADLTVRAQQLDNAGGAIKAATSADIALQGTLDNTAGLVAAGGTLHLQAGAIDNRNTFTAADAPALGLQAGDLRLTTGALDNRQGQVLADNAVLQVNGQLDNRNGQVSTSGNSDIRADTILNTAGTLASGGNQLIDARYLSGDGKVLSQGDATLTLREGLTHTGEMAANGTLSLAIQGTLDNHGKLQGGGVSVQAGQIVNAATGEITSVGLTRLVAADALVNRGLLDGTVNHITAATLENLGSGRIYGDHLAIQAGTLINRAETLDGATKAATIAARERLDIGAGSVTNSGQSLIYSDGDAAIGGALDGTRAVGSAQRVDNLSSTIEITGNLDVNALAVNNIRENVVVEQVSSTDATVRMDQPGWFSNGQNDTNNIRSTSNYVANEIYYLNPADILEDTPYITPDGYQIRRAVVRLTANTSAYFFGRGGLNAGKGERSRMVMQDGTVVLYYTSRQDNQSNPDQLGAGAEDPFREVSYMEPGKPAFSYVNGMDTLNYSSAYGTCTTTCVQLITWAQYSDPDHTLTNMQRHPSNTRDNEQYRLATHSTVEDVVRSAGAEATIHAGGNMRITTDALLNQYARIAAGGNLDIVGLNRDTSKVENVFQTLYRTHSFDNTSVTYRENVSHWSNPDISEQVGVIGGGITAGGTLTVDVGDLSNLNTGRDAPNVQDGDSVANLNTQGPGGGAVGPGVGPVRGPGQAQGQGADTAAAQGPSSATAAQGQIGTGLQGPGRLGGNGAEGSNAQGPDAVAAFDPGAGNGVTPGVSGADAGRAIATGPQGVQAGQHAGSSGTAGNSALAQTTAVKAAGDDPRMVVMTPPNGTAPVASLFNVNANHGSHLVETDPKFASYREWLSSDYLLTRAGYDPATLQKRLGDGFYEQRLMREQIGQLTGRRFLDGYASDEDQYRSLLEAGATVASAWGLRPGVALSAEQMAQLTSDIVWLVEQDITLADGSTTRALVPQVYLRVMPGDLDRNGTLLAGANVDITLRGDLVNNGAIAGRQVVSIDAGNIRNIGGAQISGQQVDLQATQNIDIIGSTVTATDALSLKAGGDITVASTLHTWESNGELLSQRTTTLDRMAGLYVTGANGQGMLSVDAGGDVNLKGAQVINAGSNGLTVLAAAGDVNIAALTEQRSVGLVHDARNFNNQSALSQIGSSVSGAGHVVLQAGNDITLRAAQINAGKAMVVQAAGDINALAAINTASGDSGHHSRNHAGAVQWQDQQVVGTTLNAGSDIALQAGRDIVLQATQVRSENGGIAAAAGRDLLLSTVDETHTLSIDQRDKKRGTLSSTTTTTHDAYRDTYAIGSSLSGERVDLAAGRDLTLEAALVAGDQGVSLTAGNDINILAGQNTHSESHSREQVKRGALGNGGIGFTVGKQTTGDTMDLERTQHTGSIVGSSAGRVDILAGNNVDIAGSDVLSQAGTLISGENVTIRHVEDSETVRQTQYSKSGGLNVSLRGGAADVATAVYQSGRRAGESDDDRLKALYAAKGAQTLFSGGAGSGMNAIRDVQNLDPQLVRDAAGNTQVAGTAGMSLRVGVGGSSSSSEINSSQTTAQGSRIASEGDVAIVARSGDINVTGSHIQGDNVALAAARDLVLKSAEQRQEQTERNKASSGEIGVTVGTEAGLGVYVSASAAKGRGNGSSTTHAETTVQANNTLTLVSGRDTTLEGAQAIGERVIANVGRDLTLTSQQDRTDYDRSDKSGGIDAAIGTGGGQVSGYYNQQKIDSNYVSVEKQTGIQAGAGGFDINVGGHTALTGAAIASTADPSRNVLSTGSLSVQDLQNEARYKATSAGVSASSQGGNLLGNAVGAGLNLAVGQTDNASSVTASDIAAGTVVVRDGTTAALEGMSRDATALQQDGLKAIFDEKKVVDRLEMGQLAGEVGFTAVGDIAIAMQNKALDNYQSALTQFDEAQAKGDPAGMAQATLAASNAKQDLARWADGSPAKTALHVAAGGLQAAFGGGNALAGALGAGANEVAAGRFDSELVGAGIALGMGMLSGSGGSGLATAISGTSHNRLLHASEQDAIKKLVGEGYPRELLNAVACSEVRCWEGSDLGVMAEVVQKQTAETMASLDPAQKAALLTKLKQDAPNLFNYSVGDYLADNEVVPKLKSFGNLVLDVTPVIGDGKGYYEAETPSDYFWATVGLLPLAGDAVKGIAKAERNVLKSADSGLLNHLDHSALQGPYNPKAYRSELEAVYGSANIVSTTVPPAGAKNARLAGKSHPVTGVVFDSRGFPIFDDITAFDVKIPPQKFLSASYENQMRLATQELAGAIQAGAVKVAGFTPRQLEQIRSGSKKIEGYTWHHHQESGRMQLVPEIVHQKTGHVGGEAIGSGM
ncbi:hemagglutinin repeat-containing protein [Stenotrophomonas sp. 169]|uniref:hemagglutinin repeat-containing protein n=1 Tax=Stenotrophomonas sp. 169 TaxID=2770322 RepID=UPI00166233F0|nr:hemagglutinin repeat-containing protein [Stenotrophomonas sp. 169]QNR97485.1 hemagglutinin repeat-containing protein [Stenotrophomonas sp. 169]